MIEKIIVIIVLMVIVAAFAGVISLMESQDQQINGLQNQIDILYDFIAKHYSFNDHENSDDGK